MLGLATLQEISLSALLPDTLKVSLIENLILFVDTLNPCPIGSVKGLAKPVTAGL